MTPLRDERIEKLAKVLVRYSTDVQAGDLVRISGSTVCEPLVMAVYRETLLAGGHPLVRMTPSHQTETMLRFGTDEQIGFVSSLSLQEIETIDCDVMIWGSENTKSLTNVDPAKQLVLSKSKKSLYDIYDRREADDSLRWVGAEFPTHSSAQDAEQSLWEFERFVFQAGMLLTEDPVAAWRRLRQQQQQMCDFLQSVRELKFKTPDGTDLSMSVEGRNWINCHGRRNFPDGEVYTGPIEESTEGVVRFGFPAVYQGREVDGIRLEFRDGKVVDASATKGEAFLHEILELDAGARVLGEVGIGTNYSITRYSKNTLFDEKIGGTFHTALGASYPKSGGKNQSAIHWDLVCDLRDGGQILADGIPIGRNGQFLNGDWPQPID